MVSQVDKMDTFRMSLGDRLASVALASLAIPWLRNGRRGGGTSTLCPRLLDCQLVSDPPSGLEADARHHLQLCECSTVQVKVSELKGKNATKIE